VGSEMCIRDSYRDRLYLRNELAINHTLHTLV